MTDILKHTLWVFFTLLLLGLNTSASSLPLPGSEKHPLALLQQIKQLENIRGNQYSPRTKHLNSSGKANYTNRLFLESSPYLLQHAHNPVNWYAWGDDAFAMAKKLNRPILLSVGYSTCHWCHVMEEESFEDIEIATYINAHFIAIKVDREERPDIDAIYMAALHAFGKNGGWPMNVWLTPERKPFYGGTYYPARAGDRGASIGFLGLLKKLNQAYQEQPEKITEVSEQLALTIARNLQTSTDSTLPKINVFDLAAGYYKQNADEFYGGIGNAPKFPSTTPIQFLLRYHLRTGDKKALDIVKLSLSKMAAGGIYDHVGGGFHRYAIDTEWLVPHFEKMLYDNALLVVDYLEAYQVTGDINYQHIVNETLKYIQREMTNNKGGFYSATDADSLTPSGHNEEGYFFTWSEDELEKTLGKSRAELIRRYYATSQLGNFEGRNILHSPIELNTFAQQNNMTAIVLRKIINESNSLLRTQRQKRPAPLRDEKILAAWNGLMISAFSKAGFAFDNQNYIQQAEKSAQFILNNLVKNKRLLRSYKDGVAKHNAYLNDYAFFIAGLLDLYEATHNIKWLRSAIEMDKILEQQYEDKKNGGFFLTSHDHEKLLAREKPAYDSAVPTGNSIHALNLLRLNQFTSDYAYRERAENIFKAFSSILKTNPMSLSKMLVALDFYYNETKQIVIVTPINKKIYANSFVQILREKLLPNRVLAVVQGGNELINQQSVLPILENKIAIGNKVTAYVCKFGECELPTNNVDTFADQITHE